MLPHDLYIVVGEEKGQEAYYVGWWHTYAQPLFSYRADSAVKKMTRGNANRVRRRLENPQIWGGTWRVEKYVANHSST